MTRRLVLFLLLTFAPTAAFAQSTMTTAQLQALATQDAQAAGIPANVFLAQIQAESGFNPNVGCNSYGACGIAQFIPSTAAQFGIDPNNPTQALQAAAQYDAQLEQQDGSLTAALTAYSGGLTPANPGDYGTVFADAAAAGGGGTAGITVSTTDGGGTPAAATGAGATGAATAANSFNPFTYLWTQYSNSIATPLANEVATIQNLIQPWVAGLLIVMLAALGISAYVGRLATSDLYYRMLRIAIVVPFVAVGSTWYQTYVVGLFQGLPTQFSQTILGNASPNPAAGFDVVFHAFNQQATNIYYSLPSWHVATLFGDTLLLFLAGAIVWIAVALMFAVWIVAQAILALLLVIGPLIVLALLFDYMRGWFDRWISAMLLMVLVTLAADLISSVILQVILGAIGALTLTGQATQDTFNLVGVALVVVVMGAALVILPRVLEFLAAAGGAPVMNHAQRILQTVVYRPASTVVTGAPGLLGRITR